MVVSEQIVTSLEYKIQIRQKKILIVSRIKTKGETGQIYKIF